MAKKSTELISTNALPNALAWARKTAVSTPPASSPPRCLRNLEHAAEHEDLTEELTDVLSTANVTAEYRVETGLEID